MCLGDFRLHSRCGRCSAAVQRRFHERKKLARLKKTLREVLRGRLIAQELLQRGNVLVGLCGGWKGIAKSLPPEKRAELALRMADAAEREFVWAEEKQRHEALSAGELESAAMRADLAWMSQEWVEKHPVRAMRVMLCDKPQLLIQALLGDERGRAALRRALERNPQALQDG